MTGGRVLAVSIPLLLVGGLWGAWQYRQHRSYQTLVPAEATMLIRIHLDGLFKDVGLNALCNSNYYDSLRREGAAGGGFRPWRDSGASIPANLFLFQLAHAQSEAFPDTYFGALKLSDTAAFTTLLRTRFGMRVSRATNGEAVAVADHAMVVCSADRACFAVSLRKPSREITLLGDILRSLLPADGHAPVSESKFRAINRIDGHMAILGNYRASVRFGNGEAGFSIKLPIRTAPPSSGGIPDFSPDNTASLWLNGLIGDWWTGTRFEIDGHTLHGDSLLRHYRGNMVLEWKGAVTQTDTAIGYDYDEDFTMRERLEFVEKPVPEVYLSMAADSGLMGYLAAQGVLDTTAGRIDRSVFPLFRIRASVLADGYVQWHTAERPGALPQLRKGSEAVLYARMDFGRLDDEVVPAGMLPFTQLLTVFEATGRTGDEGNVDIVGNVRMKNRRINGLAQLLGAGL